MSDKLSTELAEIIVKIKRELPDNWSLHDLSVFCDSIEQAFEDAGYYPLMPDEQRAVADYNDGKLMSGQEWYDRLMKELDKDVGYTYGHMQARFLAAAKQAADLEAKVPKLSEMSQTYKNDDAQLQAEEIHPVLEVSGKPDKFKSNVKVLGQADLNKNVFTDLSAEYGAGYMGTGVIGSFDNKKKTAAIFFQGSVYQLPYSKLQIIKYEVPK